MRVMDLKIPLSAIDQRSKQEIGEDRVELNHTLRPGGHLQNAPPNNNRKYKVFNCTWNIHQVSSYLGPYDRS